MNARRWTLTLTGIVAAAGAAPGQSRSEIEELRELAILQTQIELEETIEAWDGLDEIRSRVAPLREEAAGVFERSQSSGRRVALVGDHWFNRNISPAAILDHWDTDYGDEDPVGVVIDFHQKLAALDIDLIVVPVPSKIELYYSEFDTFLPDRFPVSPGRLEAMLALLDAEVEVVDLLPLFFDGLEEADVPMYETSGHHPSGYAAKIAGELVAQRLERYAFEDSDPTRFSTIRRTGTERIDRSVAMKAWPVMLDDETYEHVDESPVVVIGDSNAFAYGSASFACHIARAAGMPITDRSTSSGASSAHAQLANLGLVRLKTRKVVIWVITSSQLQRFPWRKSDLPPHPTLKGLVELGEYEAAIRTYYEVRASTPPSERLDENGIAELGQRLLTEGRAGTAADIFKIGTLEHPYSANAFANFGQACLQAQRPDQAREAFETALRLYPSASARESCVRGCEQLGVELPTPPAVTLSDEQRQRLLGHYTLEPDASGEIRLRGGNLEYVHIGQPAMILRPITPTVFNTAEDFTLVFEEVEGELQLTLRGVGRFWQGTRPKGD